MADLTSAESPAVLLRRAATHLDELAKGATPGPWSRPYPGASCLAAPAPGDEDPVYTGRGQVEVIRSAVWEGTGEFVRSRTDRDLDWIAALSPVVAAPLAEWLRETAEYIGAVQCSPPVGAVALARALLGDLPDTPKETPDGDRS